MLSAVTLALLLAIAGVLAPAASASHSAMERVSAGLLGRERIE